VTLLPYFAAASKDLKATPNLWNELWKLIKGDFALFALVTFDFVAKSTLKGAI
jgi:hypothetical protein